MRLGDLDALKEALKSNCKPEICHDYGTNWCEACCPHNDFEDLIDEAPTVSFIISPGYVTELQNHNKELIKQLEKVERPQGEWKYSDDMYETLVCSVCGFDTDDYIRHNFCPNCGAKMKGGEE